MEGGTNAETDFGKKEPGLEAKVANAMNATDKTLSHIVVMLGMAVHEGHEPIKIEVGEGGVGDKGVEVGAGVEAEGIGSEPAAEGG